MNSEKNVDFSNSDPANISSVYTAQTQSCSSLCCHSNGRSLNSQSGAFNWTGGALTCGSCHSLTNLSGKHTLHLTEGRACGDCHTGVQGSDTIVDFSTHVDGKIDYNLPLQYTNERCNGFCHEHDHQIPAVVTRSSRDRLRAAPRDCSKPVWPSRPAGATAPYYGRLTRNM